MTNDKTVIMSRELAPCPFCQSNNVHLTRDMYDTDEGRRERAQVRCWNCKLLTGTFKANAEAVAYWNTRAAPFVERQDGSVLMKIAADLANRHPLRQLYLVCEHQGRINTDSLHEHLDKCGDLLAGIALDIRRAITTQAAPAKLTVWEGAMPESNGKSNFTVILHTGDLTEGICVYRSEYPDRARYEADCFRHLIGDPAFPEKPFICDYDADKHSGYVKPYASPPAPVAVVLPERMELVSPSANHAPVEIHNSIAAGFNACLDMLKELNQ